MRFTSLSLEHFRSFPQLALPLDSDAVFLLGNNGVGKTNILEALGLVTALRSFRTQETRAMIGWEKRQARLLYRMEHKQYGESTVEMALRSGSKEVLCDGEKVNKLGDFVGRFPTVVMSSQDIQLLRGSPQLRRRFLDILLSSTNSEYLTALRTYHKALQARNQLLKRSAGVAERAAFDRQLIPAAVQLIHLRNAGIEALKAHLTDCYASFANGDEQPEMRYEPDCECEDEAAYARMLSDNAERDSILKTTSKGPHRDDIRLGLFTRQAREYGSEGQQRALVLALRFAQLAYVRNACGEEPVLLADDILNELDAERRKRFWTVVSSNTQVIATGTSPPDAVAGREWKIITIEEIGKPVP